MKRTLSILIVVLVAFAATLFAADRSGPPITPQSKISAQKFAKVPAKSQTIVSVRAIESAAEIAVAPALRATETHPAVRTESFRTTRIILTQPPNDLQAYLETTRPRPKISGFSGLNGDHFARADV